MGIVGSEGYLAGELIRLLYYHSAVNIKFVHSDNHIGKKVAEIHHDIPAECNLVFSNSWKTDVDVIFLCESSQSKDFWAGNIIPFGIKLINLNNDVVHPMIKSFVYGLPEIYGERIKRSNYIVSPGGYETSVELALMPVAAYLTDDVYICSVVSSTGLSQVSGPYSEKSYYDKEGLTNRFRMSSMQPVHDADTGHGKAGYVDCIYQKIVPGNFSRGIYTTMNTKCTLSEQDLTDLYRACYKDHSFVIVTDVETDLKKVINTNKCYLSIRKKGDFVFIISILDNLIKGGSGQAVQNMNLMFQLPETSGLLL